MPLGWLDVCIRVADVASSRTFYGRIGFDRVEGDDDQGWAVLSNGSDRIGLFSAEFMGGDVFSLNFRGGDVPKIAAELQARGCEFEKPPVFLGTQAGSIKLRDPDGNLVFIDSFPDEAKKELTP